MECHLLKIYGGVGDKKIKKIKRKKMIKFAFMLPNAPCRFVIDHESVGKIRSVSYKSERLQQALS